jgi:hypothetical protein
MPVFLTFLVGFSLPAGKVSFKEYRHRIILKLILLNTEQIAGFHSVWHFYGELIKNSMDLLVA